MMVVPLILGAFTNTFLPGVLEIGGFTTALTRDGVLPLIAAFLVCMGAGIAVDEAPQSIEQGVAIIGAKFLVGVAIGLVVANVLGDSLFGLSSLAITAATTNTNGDLYAALVGELGNATDVLQDCIRVLIRADAVREATTHRRNVKGAATGSRGRRGSPIPMNALPAVVGSSVHAPTSPSTSVSGRSVDTRTTSDTPVFTSGTRVAVPTSRPAPSIDVRGCRTDPIRGSVAGDLQI